MQIPSDTLDESPCQCFAVHCVEGRTCVLYVDVYTDGTLAALHGLPGDPHATHAQRWAPGVTRTTRRTVLLTALLRYIHPELAADPREWPAFAVTPVQSAPPLPWLDTRGN
jgi:hypothetical protein